jgi:hypothetical protein
MPEHLAQPKSSVLLGEARSLSNPGRISMRSGGFGHKRG